MNRILLFLILLIVSGCTTSVSNSQNATASSSNNCPDQPVGSLDSKNVKQIQLSSQTITESGQVRSGEYLGYAFEAKSGQKLSFKTDEVLCIWLYAPDNQIITSKNLSQTGKYIIQVSAPKGSTNFDLAMNLKTETAASASSLAVTPAPVTTIPTPTITNNISRPLPEEVIKDYYAKINNHQYRDAWNILPVAVQQNKTLHPDGYNSFLEWWNKVSFVDVQKVVLAESNNNSATVSLGSKYHMKSGRIASISLKFYMTWNEANQSWDMNSIKVI